MRRSRYRVKFVDCNDQTSYIMFDSYTSPEAIVLAGKLVKERKLHDCKRGLRSRKRWYKVEEVVDMDAGKVIYPEEEK